MPHLIKCQCLTEKLSFSYTVSINNDGLFSTTIPKEVVDKLEMVGISLGRNRKNNTGYFCSETLDSLKKEIYDVAIKYSKKELVEEKIVLLYSIDTTCFYCKGKTGIIYPDGRWEQEAEGDYNWQEGTIQHDACHSGAYGFSIFCAPKLLSTWKFPTGEIFKDYQGIPEEMIKEGSTLHWLNSIRAMNLDNGKNPKEIKYTKEIGQFFKSLILYICETNERLKEVFTEEVDIQKAIELKQTNLLPFWK
jgi:hypothetical protein